MKSKSKVLSNGKFETTFGKLINCQAFNDTVDIAFIESCMSDAVQPGSFDSDEEFLEFIKEHFNTEVECDYEFDCMDSCYYVDFEVDGKAFCLPFWDDELYADTYNCLMETYDTGDEKFDLEYWKVMMEDLDNFYDKPNF